MKTITLLQLLIVVILLTSCVSKKEITKEEVKKDSINTENSYKQIDTIYKERLVRLFEPVYTEVEVPCDSAKFNQVLDVGKMGLKIIKEKGQVKIVLKRDSSSTKWEKQYKALFKENNTLKSQISSFKETKTKEVVKKPFFANVWMILFFIFFVLWILGITPKFLISKFL